MLCSISGSSLITYLSVTVIQPQFANAMILGKWGACTWSLRRWCQFNVMYFSGSVNTRKWASCSWTSDFGRLHWLIPSSNMYVRTCFVSSLFRKFYMYTLFSSFINHCPLATRNTVLTITKMNWSVTVYRFILWSCQAGISYRTNLFTQKQYLQDDVFS